jgi:hypothetical protein
MTVSPVHAAGVEEMETDVDPFAGAAIIGALESVQYAASARDR